MGIRLRLSTTVQALPEVSFCLNSSFSHTICSLDNFQKLLPLGAVPLGAVRNIRLVVLNCCDYAGSTKYTMKISRISLLVINHLWNVSRSRLSTFSSDSWTPTRSRTASLVDSPQWGGLWVIQRLFHSLGIRMSSETSLTDDSSLIQTINSIWFVSRRA